jgi:hypothetical protein
MSSNKARDKAAARGFLRGRDGSGLAFVSLYRQKIQLNRLRLRRCPSDKVAHRYF